MTLTTARATEQTVRLRLEKLRTHILLLSAGRGLPRKDAVFGVFVEGMREIVEWNAATGEIRTIKS